MTTPATLPLDDIRVCYHDDGDGCACRKPKPGMMYAAAVEREIDLARSFLVGDRWRDIGAGKAAGCTTILVNAFPEEARPEGQDLIAPGQGESVMTESLQRRRARLHALSGRVT